MKKVKFFGVLFLSFLLIAGIGCGSSATGDNGEETNGDEQNTEEETGDNTPTAVEIDTSTVSAKIADGMSALIPTVTVAGLSEMISLLPKAVTYETADTWANTYLTDDYSYLLTDIFGDPDEVPAPATRIRVVSGNVENRFEEIFTADPDITCEGLGTDILNEGDEIDIAFYGSIANGTEEDRFFDCVIPDDGHGQAIIYGKDADENIRVVVMSVSEGVNEIDPDIRGDAVEFYSVIYATYGEVSETVEVEDENDTVYSGFIDIQYTQATIYNGADNNFDETDDNVLFKSSTRIAGKIEYSTEDNVTLDSAEGDFKVIKYDSSPGFQTTTQTAGRGSFGSSEYAIFRIETDNDALADAEGIYCIQQSADVEGVPAAVDETENCEPLEAQYAWGEDAFSFDLSPAIEAAFEDNELFTETDLIADNGSNFTIPEYTVAE